MGNDKKVIQFPKISDIERLNRLRPPINPNRRYIRDFKKAFHLQGKTNSEVAELIRILRKQQAINKLSKTMKEFRAFKEGDVVKLNVESILSHPTYADMDENWKKFVDKNADKQFTVEYDPKFKDTATMVCFKEDTTDPKWLWYEGDLILINAVDEVKNTKGDE